MENNLETGKYVLSKLESLFHNDYSSNEKVKALYRLFTLFWEELTNPEKLNFTTLFVRISFAASKYKQLNGVHIFNCHRFRRFVENNKVNDKNANEIFILGSISLRDVLYDLYKINPSSLALIKAIIPEKLKHRKYEVVKFQAHIRILVLDIDEKEMTVTFVTEEEGVTKQTAYFDLENRNEIFNNTILHLKRYFQLPLIANLIDVEIDDNNRYLPAAIVLNPDFLVDATAIAKLFQHSGVYAPSYLISKFIPIDPNKHLLMGNIANTFLDHLLYNPETSFREISKSVFSLNPLQITQFSDAEVTSLLKDAQNHYQNIKESLYTEFKTQGIDTRTSYVEPTFLSNVIGFQGRLDLLQMDEESDEVNIVELKSGSPFKANRNKVNESHYRQLLTYEMIISNLNNRKYTPKGFVLYSKLKAERLRYSGHSKFHQYEILNLRNTCLFLEQMLLNNINSKKDIFEKFDPRKIDEVFRFEKRDAEKLYIAYKQCDGLEKIYIKNFVGFISQEYQLAKTGIHGLDRSNGMAGLWLDSESTKAEEFRVINNLTIGKNKTAEENPIVQLNYSIESNRLSKFRIGDIIILYPKTPYGNAAINYQLFKATLIDISEHNITCRLRSRQMNSLVFDKFKYWNIESDFLDGSITKMYKNLYRFMCHDYEVRQLLLGRKAPQEYVTRQVTNDTALTKEQNQIVNEIISAKDYYLLWGPPGTGKTSVIIKNLVKYYFEKTEENILLLAYTNRAVDEICTALQNIPSLNNDFLRIGSRYSSNPNFVNNILSVQLEEINSRDQLNKLINGKRIYVSTVSSIQSNWDLFKLKNFSNVIIDEASQLLEPYLIGILGNFKKFVLIGDHKQLPAVVTQDKQHTQVQDEKLLDIQLEDLRNSLFERLYKIAQKNEWNWAYGILTKQGRMHYEIMQFSSKHFYDGQLKILDKINRLKDDKIKDNDIINQHRLLFIDTPIDDSLNHKVNYNEAEIVVKVYKSIHKLLLKNDVAISQDTIGIITPFRAQIAQIKSTLESTHTEIRHLSIDTVERYQGSARDYIIISLATNDHLSLHRISNKSDEGLDRKLNVALTRAREQIVIIGNKTLVSHDPIYRNLLSYCKVISSTEII